MGHLLVEYFGLPLHEASGVDGYLYELEEESQVLGLHYSEWRRGYFLVIFELLPLTFSTKLSSCSSSKALD